MVGTQGRIKMLHLLRTILFLIFRIFPIDPKKIIFESFWGKGYNDNPKYICQKILAAHPEYKVYWLFEKNADIEVPNEIKKVRCKSLGSIYHLATAKVWIDNCRKGDSTKKRKRQVYIQTWHGFGPKRAEKDVAATLSEQYVRSAIYDSGMCDLMISSSKMLTSIYERAFWYNGEILQCGYPRNDIFASVNNNIAAAVHSYFHIPENVKIALYAPTFRHDHCIEKYYFSFEKLLRALGRRWDGDWVLLIRLHPNISHHIMSDTFNHTTILDATKYPDMQELLYSSDVLITDYSSSVTDFLLSGHPSFIYAPDIAEYKEDRDFYFELTELPGPVCENEAALILAINEFDETSYDIKRKRFIQQMGIFEAGDASQKVVDWIICRLKSDGGGSAP